MHAFQTTTNPAPTAIFPGAAWTTRCGVLFTTQISKQNDFKSPQPSCRTVLCITGLAPAEPHARRVDIGGAGGQTAYRRREEAPERLRDRNPRRANRAQTIRRGRFCIDQTKEREILFVSDKGEGDFGSIIILRGEGYFVDVNRIIILKKKKVDEAPTTERAV